LDPQDESANINAALGTDLGNGYEEDVVVLSAGPDEEVDTRIAVDGLTGGDDDLVSVVSSNSRP
jgi:hypothetical protein